MSARSLHRFAVLLTAATVCLIFAGGLVTSTGSGLSVPDWPLSYGQFFPKMVGGIRYEHSHRVIAGTIGVLTLIFSILLWRFERRAWVKRLGFAALSAVILQAVLGGLTVIYFLPTWISVFHACLGQTFLCICACIALVTGGSWDTQPPRLSPKSAAIRGLALTTSLLVFAQLIAGALVRHSDHMTVRYHFLLALVVALFILKLLRDVAKQGEAGKPLFDHAFLLGALTITQCFLGFTAFFLTRVQAQAIMPPAEQVLIATSHQTLGALILMTTVLLAVKSFRYLAEPTSAGTGGR